MSEFSNRIAAQRTVLSVVNEAAVRTEPLYGLSNDAIQRWMLANRIESSSELVGLLKAISAHLSFLANKSQDQVSEEYLRRSGDVNQLTEELRLKLAAG